jgi:thiosulfate/3-mercaptopyruvate sulfurtransferase
LNGGLPRWLKEGRPVTAEKPVPIQTTYTPRPNPALVADADAVRAALSGAGTVLDARSAERFAGKAPDPRPGVRPGHMPGAANMPFANLLDGGGLKSPQELSAIFTDAGITPETPVVTSCGSGVTAAVLSLALEVIGSRAHALYDGSWSEWGAETNDNALFPVVTDAED